MIRTALVKLLIAPSIVEFLTLTAVCIPSELCIATVFGAIDVSAKKEEFSLRLLSKPKRLPKWINF